MLDIVYISQSKQYCYRVQLKQGPSLTLYSKFEIQKYRTSRIWASTFTLSSLHHWRTTDSSAFLMTHKKQISRLRVDSVERGLFLLWNIQQSNQFKPPTNDHILWYGIHGSFQHDRVLLHCWLMDTDDIAVWWNLYFLN